MRSVVPQNFWGLPLTQQLHFFLKRRKNLSYTALMQRTMTEEDGFVLPLLILLIRNMIGPMSLKSEVRIRRNDAPV